MDYYGLLFLYYLKGLSGKSVLRLFFNIEAGGTEQLLPSGLMNGFVDLGSLTWNYSSENQIFGSNVISDMAKGSTTKVQLVCSKYNVTTAKTLDEMLNTPDKTIAINNGTLVFLRLKDLSYTDATALKESLQGVYLWYETTNSTPTTTPILADIQYPDGLRTDQYFTYRETPTTVSNKARIKTIKGNTLVWNQLVQNGNFADLSSWLFTDYATSVSDNTLTLTSSTTNQTANTRQIGVNIPNGHKFIVLCDVKVSQPTFRIILRDSSNISNNFTDTLPLNTWTKYGKISVTTLDVDRVYIYPNRDGVSGATCELKNFMIFDLTAMGLDSITSVEEFTSLFPLSYYSYNQGSLLSFNGNGIKTVGKNLLKTNDSLSWTPSLTKNEDGSIHVQGSRTSDGVYVIGNITLLANKTYVIKKTGNADCYIQLRYDGQTLASVGRNDVVYTPTQNIECTIRLFARANVNFDFTIYPQIEFGSISTDYESYTENTTSLPISTYFPNGMNGFDGIYDELAPTSAKTRIKSYTFTGNETVTEFANLGTYSRAQINGTITQDIKNYGTTVGGYAKVKSDFAPFDANYTSDSLHFYFFNATWRIFLPVSTTAEALAYLTGKKVLYELATPIETPITTEDANEALSLLMGKSVSSSNANQLINIITKGE